MATKVKIMKMLQEIHGLADITSRRPTPKAPGLFLIQLRSHVQQATSARRKQTIAVATLEKVDIPHPVKIRHVYQPLFPTAA
jgi:hypothetical protein